MHLMTLKCLNSWSFLAFPPDPHQNFAPEPHQRSTWTPPEIHLDPISHGYSALHYEINMFVIENDFFIFWTRFSPQNTEYSKSFLCIWELNLNLTMIWCYPCRNLIRIFFVRSKTCWELERFLTAISYRSYCSYSHFLRFLQPFLTVLTAISYNSYSHFLIVLT